MLHTLLAALALAVTMSVAAGCGGSSKTVATDSSVTAKAATTTTPTQTTAGVATGEEIKLQTGKPLSRAAWIADGDAICARANEKLNTTTVKTTRDFARALPQAAAYDRAEATELSKLVPPTAMVADWRQVVTGFQKFGEFTSKAAEDVQANKFDTATPLIIAGTTIQKQLTMIAKRDGFKMCSQV